MKQRVLCFLGVSVIFFLAIWFFWPSDKDERVDLKVNRFEEELFLITIDNVIEKVDGWDAKFTSFNEIFMTQIMQIHSRNKEDYYDGLIAFTYNKDMREAYDSTAYLFSDFSDLKRELEFAFGQFSVYFPGYPIPEITTFFGGFNYGVITYDNNIAIGLENFLGENSKYYQYLGNPQYLRFQKQRKFISSNVMEVWFNELFQQYLGGRDLLSQLIYKGKMMYFLDRILPDLDMEDKFRFTSLQMDWVEKNEASIWEYFVQEDLLFSKEESKFRSFVDYAPFAKGMPKESPGRVGYFIGYRMVVEYVKNNNISIKDLMLLTDSRKFLQKSSYKPNK